MIKVLLSPDVIILKTVMQKSIASLCPTGGKLPRPIRLKTVHEIRPEPLSFFVGIVIIILIIQTLIERNLEINYNCAAGSSKLNK